MSSSITQGHLEAISAIERACSVLSLLGCLFTIVTFCSSKSFHKPINRLVFYASFGNMMTNVGTLMSRSYMAKIDSFPCQFQAWLIQLFMPADAFWTLAMAINVYLTFYFKYDGAGLRRMEVPYLVACYGIPAIPAFAFLFIRDGEGVRVYGNATLWCWVGPEWDVLRIAAFYGPVWIVISATLFIYLRAGRTIYEKHKQLRGFQFSDPDALSVNGEAVTTIKTTEVTVMSEMAVDEEAESGSTGSRGLAAGPSSGGPNGVYKVHISADSHGTPRTTAKTRTNDKKNNGINMEGGQEGFALPTRKGTMIQQTRSTRVTPLGPANIARRRNLELNNAAWSYTKCSILFFTAIFITWIPSSANRVYSVVHHEDSLLALEYMSAFVLPLQGFWNAVIYATTSWSACLHFFGRLGPNRMTLESRFGSRYGHHGRSVAEAAGSNGHGQFRASHGSLRSLGSTSPADNRARLDDESQNCSSICHERPVDDGSLV